MKKIKDFFDSLSSGKDSPARIRLLLIAGAAAILLLVLPEMFSGCGTDDTAAEKSDSFDSRAYVSQLEEKLEDMIGSVEGAGKTKVMITLQNGIEYIYASEDKISLNSSETTGSNGSMSSEEKENSENSYIIIEDEKGERALIRTELMPSINGVVVICEGAENSEVAERIRQVVTTALNISSRRVCITQLSTD